MMNGLFASPLAFIALVSLPALAAIYLFRNRFDSCEVSSLIFWEDRTKVSAGGLQIERIKTPLLFILELLTLIMLVLAAAGPLLRSGKDTRVLSVVLDDSFSMQAGTEQNARDRAADSLIEMLEDAGPFRVTLITAGKDPQVLANSLTSTPQVRQAFSKWKCSAPSADIGSALALASELGGKNARLLVLTDHAPDNALDTGTIEWHAYGDRQPNYAFVTAVRDYDGEQQQCVLTIANYSGEPADLDLNILPTDAPDQMFTRKVTILPNNRKRVRFALDASAGAIEASFADGRLEFDNKVTLLPAADRNVSVSYKIKDESLRQAVIKAIDATGLTSVTSRNPRLLLTDESVTANPQLDTWVLRFTPGEKPNAYIGPFVINRAHPLTEGLSFEGVIWAAADESAGIDVPVVMAGNVPLIHDVQLPGGQHALTVNLNSDMSTLSQAPDWPVMFWNLVNWRRSRLPGPDRINTRLGSQVALTFPLDEQAQTAAITMPDQTVVNLPLTDSRTIVRTVQPGIYKAVSGLTSYNFVVNPVSPAESNLSNLAAGKWGQWADAEKFWWEYRNVDWIPLIVALLLLAIHRILTSRSSVRI